MNESAAADAETHTEWRPRVGSDFYYASLYYPSAARSRLCALDALRREIARIPASCSDRGVAHVKLAWWHEEIGRMANRRPRHAIATAVCEHVTPLEPVLEAAGCFVDAVVSTLGEPRYDTREDVIRAVADLHGGFLDAMLQPALTGADAATVHRLGGVIDIGHSLRRLREQRGHGSIWLAQEDLAAHGLSIAAVRDATRSTPLAPLLAPVFSGLRDEIGRLLHALSRPQRRALRLLVALARYEHTALGYTLDEGCPVLERRFELTPLHKLAIAWRTRYVG